MGKYKPREQVIKKTGSGIEPEKNHSGQNRTGLGSRSTRCGYHRKLLLLGGVNIFAVLERLQLGVQFVRLGTQLVGVFLRQPLGVRNVLHRLQVPLFRLFNLLHQPIVLFLPLTLLPLHGGILCRIPIDSEAVVELVIGAPPTGTLFVIVHLDLSGEFQPPHHPEKPPGVGVGEMVGVGEILGVGGDHEKVGGFWCGECSPGTVRKPVHRNDSVNRFGKLSTWLEQFVRQIQTRFLGSTAANFSHQLVLLQKQIHHHETFSFENAKLRFLIHAVPTVVLDGNLRMFVGFTADLFGRIVARFQLDGNGCVHLPEGAALSFFSGNLLGATGFLGNTPGLEKRQQTCPVIIGNALGTGEIFGGDDQ